MGESRIWVWLHVSVHSMYVFPLVGDTYTVCCGYMSQLCARSGRLNCLLGEFIRCVCA